MPVYELAAAGLLTACLLGALAIGLGHDLLWGVTMLAGTTIILQLAFTWWARCVVVERLRSASTPPAAGVTLSVGKV
jgi:hypothetical protein